MIPRTILCHCARAAEYRASNMRAHMYACPAGHITSRSWDGESFTADHDGGTYDPLTDKIRLNGQQGRVWAVMKDGHWRTLEVISGLSGDPEASVSARLRDFRKDKFGGFTVERRPVGDPKGGLFEYRLDVVQPRLRREPV